MRNWTVAKTRERLAVSGMIGLSFLLSGCGHSSPETATLSVNCAGTLALAGATSIEASTGSANATLLSFPDPANAGHTGTIAVTSGQPCTITPVLNKGG